MAKQVKTKKNSEKKQLFETVYFKLDSALAEYKDYLGKKKTTGRLKKTSKEIASRIERNMKKAKQRQLKLKKKAAKAEEKSAA